MAANDGFTSDVPEYEARGEGQADASEKTHGADQALADTQTLATISSGQPAIVDSDAEALAALKKLEEQRKANRRKRIIATVATCAVALALIGVWVVVQTGVLSLQKESATSTAVVKRTNLTTSVQSTGIMLPSSPVSVTPEVSGIIEDVMVSDGQKVEAGSVLFTLRNNDIDDMLKEEQITLSRANRDLEEARAGVAEAQAEYSDALKEHESYVAELEAEERGAVAHAEKARKKTYDEAVALIPEYITGKERKKLIVEAEKAAQEAYDLTYVLESPGEIPEFDDSLYRASIDSANSVAVSAEEYVADLQRSYDSTVAEADKRTVRAPVSGTVYDLLAVKGASVGFASGGTSTVSSLTLAKIADSSKISVDVEISEVDITAVAVGQRAVLTFAGVPNLEIEGRVESVASVSSNISDAATSLSFTDAVTFRVTVVADSSDERLKPGMSTNVKIMTKDVPDVLVVPAGAVEEDNGVSYVTVAKDEEATETERREVVVADRTYREVSIASGLEEGEIVVDRMASAASASSSTSTSASASVSSFSIGAR